MSATPTTSGFARIWPSCAWAPPPRPCPACWTRPPRRKLTHQAFLERLLAIEVDAIEERRRASLARFASLPSPFTLADFDFSAQPSVDPKLIAELATCASSTTPPTSCSSARPALVDTAFPFIGLCRTVQGWRRLR